MDDLNPVNLDKLAVLLRAQPPGIQHKPLAVDVILSYCDLQRICLCCATIAADQALRLPDDEHRVERQRLLKNGMLSDAQFSSLEHIVLRNLKTAADWSREGDDEEAAP